jgi:hypothetical protein
MRGIFSFCITLAMLATLFGLNAAENGFYERMSEAKSAAIEAESAGKERAIMENNVDRIITAKLLEQMEKNNFNPALVKEEINSELAEYLEEAGARTNLMGHNVDGGDSNNNGRRPYGWGKSGKEALDEGSGAFIIEISGRKYGEYSYSATASKNLMITKEFGKNLVARFMVPVDYTIKIFE